MAEAVAFLASEEARYITGQVLNVDGVIAFTRSIAKEVASRGITANAIAPGFIDTKMTQQLEEKYQQALLQRIPLGYFGSPRDVAEAVAFLASEEARYITGQVLNVDGGMAGA